MAEYYIRTPDRDESRGPFTSAQLLTLVEAEQVTIDTLYYDESKEEWLPIGTNIELRKEVFPEKKELKLKVDEPEESEKKKKTKKKEEAKSTVADMLAVAEKETKNARSQKRVETSFMHATFIVNNGLCLTMLLSAIMLIVPHLKILKETLAGQHFIAILNYPLIVLAIVDLLLAVYIYFGDRKLYPLVRGRAMLTLGFGAYAGWALGDLYVLLASVYFGLGTVWATLVKRLSYSLLAVAIGLGGSGFLAYLAITGYFNGFLDSVSFEFFGNSQ